MRELTLPPSTLRSPSYSASNEGHRNIPPTNSKLSEIKHSKTGRDTPQYETMGADDPASQSENESLTGDKSDTLKLLTAEDSMQQVRCVHSK